MTLREPLTAQLAVQAGWKCEARLAPAFPPSALFRGSLAVVSNNEGCTQILLTGTYPDFRVRPFRLRGLAHSFWSLCVAQVSVPDSASGFWAAPTQCNLPVLRKTAEDSCILGALWYFPVQGLTSAGPGARFFRLRQSISKSLKREEVYHVSSRNS